MPNTLRQARPASDGANSQQAQSGVACTQFVEPPLNVEVPFAVYRPPRGRNPRPPLRGLSTRHASSERRREPGPPDSHSQNRTARDPESSIRYGESNHV